MEENKLDNKFDTLCISGGGVKGFYILGAIQAAIDAGILGNVTKYVGTSIGSIISYLLAISYTPIEILVSFYSHKWLDKMKYYDIVAGINGNGIMCFTHIHEALEKLTIEKIGKLITLKMLKELYGKTLVCVTYNMTTCMTEYLGPDNYPDLPCITALRMSANVPLVFERFKYMGSFYVDGGITDNFPILKADEIGHRVLGLCLEIPEESFQDNPEDGVAMYVIKLLQIPMIHTVRSALLNSSMTPLCC